MSGGDLLPSKQSPTLRCMHYNVKIVVSDDWKLLLETKVEQNRVLCSCQDRVYPFPCISDSN